MRPHLNPLPEGEEDASAPGEGIGVGLGEDGGEGNARRCNYRSLLTHVNCDWQQMSDHVGSTIRIALDRLCSAF